MNLKPGLYIVSTPIGNLQDITLRALDVLSGSDIIFCEDTRVSNNLLTKHNIKVPLKIYNDNSGSAQRDYIKTLINAGKIVSLISDAGTPLISDPGYKLVHDLKKSNITIDVVPGACAAVAALTLSGLPTDRFIFAGFLPKARDSKIQIFKELGYLNATLIFYETAKRLINSLNLAKETLGNRDANIARELTKLYQESKSAPLSELIEYYKTTPAKGEIVLSISGQLKELITEDTIKDELSTVLLGGMSAKIAADHVFVKYKKQYSKKEIYKLANNLKDIS